MPFFVCAFFECAILECAFFVYATLECASMVEHQCNIQMYIIVYLVDLAAAGSKKFERTLANICREQSTNELLERYVFCLSHQFFICIRKCNLNLKNHK